MRDWRPGPRNAIDDVGPLRVGHASDARIRTGVSVLSSPRPFVAGVEVMGGAPGTRETDLLAPGATVERVHALVLSGGSAFGLDAASGAMAGLKARGMGFPVAGHVVPIVPAAILFDLANGGDKDWGGEPPYRALGRAALDAALDGTDDGPFPIGVVGAGTGATTADAAGGLGTASLVVPLPDGSGTGVREARVGAMVAVNALGSVLAGGGPRYLAGAHEREWNGAPEFGGHGPPDVPLGLALKSIGEDKGIGEEASGANTTIGIVATDVPLDKAGAKRLAVAGHDGLARAIWPAHTPLDGDLVFGVSTGEGAPERDVGILTFLAVAAADCMARAVARGVHAAGTGGPASR